MSDKLCKCSMAISVLGDGCRYCQPQECIDNMTQGLAEEREELAKLEQENAELKRSTITHDEWYALCNENEKLKQQLLERDAKLAMQAEAIDQTIDGLENGGIVTTKLYKAGNATQADVDAWMAAHDKVLLDEAFTHIGRVVHGSVYWADICPESQDLFVRNESK